MRPTISCDTSHGDSTTRWKSCLKGLRKTQPPDTTRVVEENPLDTINDNLP